MIKFKVKCDECGDVWNPEEQRFWAPQYCAELAIKDGWMVLAPETLCPACLVRGELGDWPVAEVTSSGD